MRLFELFQRDMSEDGDGMIDHLRDLVLDYLTPLASHEVEYVDMKDIEELLQLDHSGLVIDRTLLMQVLDPDLCRMVKQIDGDKVYISFPVGEVADKAEEDKEKDKQKIKDKASSAAMDAVKK